MKKRRYNPRPEWRNEALVELIFCLHANGWSYEKIAKAIGKTKSAVGAKHRREMMYVE